MTITDLAARVQALTSACRETDALLVPLIGWKFVGGMWFGPDGRGKGYYPSPTGSLDDGMTLVPEGFAIENFLIWPGHPSSIKLLATAKRKFGREQTIQWVHEKTDGVWVAEGATPALALTAVSLLARAALENSNG